MKQNCRARYFSLTRGRVALLGEIRHNDHLSFSVTITNPGPTIPDVRTFSRFSDARQEVVDARIYEGIHFRFADEAAYKQGGQVASWAFTNFLRPLKNTHDDDDDPQIHN